MYIRGEMKLDKVKIIVGLLIAVITIIGTVLTVDKYFAKAGDVEKEHKVLESKGDLVQERLDISITDDQIFQQQQHIQQMRNLRVFEVRSSLPELTPMEKEAMESAEGRLDELKVKKATKIKRYEAIKKGGDK